MANSLTVGVGGYGLYSNEQQLPPPPSSGGNITVDSDSFNSGTLGQEISTGEVSTGTNTVFDNSSLFTSNSSTSSPVPSSTSSSSATSSNSSGTGPWVWKYK
jgi:hypothetical protein